MSDIKIGNSDDSYQNLLGRIKRDLIKDKSFITEIVTENKQLIETILKELNEKQTTEQPKVSNIIIQKEQQTNITNDKTIIFQKNIADDIIRKITINFSTKLCGIGYIMIGKRYGEDSKEIYFIEKTCKNNFQRRINEWGDRKSYHDAKTNMVVGAEKELHRIFDQFRIKRLSQKDGHNEIEWFDFTDVRLDVSKTNLQALSDTVDIVCSKFDECYSNNTIKKVNINTATKKELMTLSGIGNLLSDNILIYRSSKKFDKIEDVKKVKSIGEAKFNAIKELICVD